MILMPVAKYTMFGSKSCIHCKNMIKKLKGKKLKIYWEDEHPTLFRDYSNKGLIDGYPTVYKEYNGKVEKYY